MVVLSDKTSRFHPRHVVLKPTQSDEFEMPVRCEWISHRPLPTGMSGFLLLLVVVGVVAGAHGGSWHFLDMATELLDVWAERTSHWRATTSEFSPSIVGRVRLTTWSPYQKPLRDRAE